MLKKITLFIVLILFSENTHSHVSHYNNLNSLEFDLFRNNKLIGTHIYEFNRNEKKLEVKSIINFEIKKLGIVLYKYYAKGVEYYFDDKLVSFKSETVQNKKNKFCEINLVNGDFIIKGSSYNGLAPKNFMIGTWWNHSIIDKKAQISAISGRIIKQKVTFIGKENINVNGQNYIALHFNFSSDDEKLSKNKKLNTDVWYEESTLNWIKASFEKNGKWEYRLKKLN